jgi:hypothetical protein
MEKIVDRFQAKLSQDKTPTISVPLVRQSYLELPSVLPKFSEKRYRNNAVLPILPVLPKIKGSKKI